MNFISHCLSAFEQAVVKVNQKYCPEAESTTKAKIRHECCRKKKEEVNFAPVLSVTESSEASTDPEKNQLHPNRKKRVLNHLLKKRQQNNFILASAPNSAK